MKSRKKLIALTIIILYSISPSLLALENTVEKTNVSDTYRLEKKIEIETFNYLNKNKIFSKNELSIGKKLELSNIIQVVKESYLEPEISTKWFNSWLYGTTENITGFIFVTLDNSTFGWDHGHAGIGHYKGGSVIEANPEVGVKLYGNRVNTYWSVQETGGIYKIKNATPTNYMNAKNYAYSKIGISYNLAPYNSGFYCSELVYKAWKSAGFYVAPRSALEFYTPLGIMNDADTIKVASFPFPS